MEPFDSIEKLITEHGSATIQRSHIALLKAQMTALTSENTELKTKVSAFEIEVRQLRRQLEDYQPVSKPGHLCPHCRRNTGNFLGNRESHIVQERMLGLERAYYKCSNPQCQKEFNEEIK